MPALIIVMRLLSYPILYYWLAHIKLIGMIAHAIFPLCENCINGNLGVAAVNAIFIGPHKNLLNRLINFRHFSI